jgi:hypothetical protein
VMRIKEEDKTQKGYGRKHRCAVQLQPMGEWGHGFWTSSPPYEFPSATASFSNGFIMAVPSICPEPPEKIFAAESERP